MPRQKKFDVFLSYNSREKEFARMFKQTITELGLRAWLDDDELRPGLPWQPLVAKAISDALSIAVLVGPSGIGPWEEEEMQASLGAAVKNKRPVFAVIFSDKDTLPEIPFWLKNRGYISIDGIVSEKNLADLHWAITGKKTTQAVDRSKQHGKRQAQSSPKGSEEMKEYAIAEHAINLFLGKEIGLSETKVFPNVASVTKYVKAIINSSPARQKETIRAVKHSYPTATYVERAQLAYLLGRVEDKECKVDAVKLLIDYLINLQDKAGSALVTAALLLERSIYISLIYLGKIEFAEVYCDRLLEDPYRDAVNRGFHLEYYGDLSALNRTGLFCPDDVSVLPVSTIEMLLKHLRNDLENGKFRPLSRIEVHTLIALSITRHVQGLFPDSMRLDIVPVLNEILLSHQKEFAGGLGEFIGFARDILERSRVSLADLFAELHGLKEMRRAGWNISFLRNGKSIRRNSPFFESVADHVFGCLLIAQTFLPEQIVDQPEYSKQKVLTMLLLHDLPEIAVMDVSDAGIRNMSEIGFITGRAYLFSAMGITGLTSWKQLGISFLNCDDVNSRTAVDIDSLDTYLQLMRYVAMPNCEITDANEWAKDIRGRLLTEEGRRIFSMLDPSVSV